ncbi:MAG: ribosomal-processing cysteine protease Prp [Saccharofermentanales bacterium]
MISIVIGRSIDGEVRNFTISGHSGFAPEGTDILCAAISVLGQTAIASLQSLTSLDIRYRIDDADAFLRCEVALPKDPDDRQYITASAILDAFTIGCEQTAASCGKQYIGISKKVIK